MSHRVGDAIYRQLLRAFPRAVRGELGDEMVRQFREAREAVSGRPVAAARLWVRAVGDACWHGLRDRLAIRESVTVRSRRIVRAPMSGESFQARASFVGGLAKDCAWGARRLRAAPGFTLVAALTLALGVGATSAIFSVVHAVLLQPLPFPQSDRVVGLFQVWEGKRDVFTSPNFLDVQARARSFSSAAAYSTSSATLTNAGDPARVVAASVTAGFFDVVQTPPLIGRTLNRADNDPGHAEVVVLSYGLWQSRFGADPGIVGRQITLNATPQTVVGVMPRAFTWPFEADFWTPFEYTTSFTTTNRGAWNLAAMARLKPGVTIDQAAAEMADLGRQLEKEYPDMNGKVGMTAFSIVDEMLGDTKRALLVLLAAVGFVLLIACVNVANLVLARSATREHELAVRVALGAGRWRLVRQAMVESLLLAALGGAAGLLLAWGGLRVLQGVRPPGIPRLDAVGLNPTLLAFTFGVTLLTGLIFGIVPALQTTARSLADALRERGRSALSGPRGRATRYALIVAELALAVLLLTGAGLLIRSFAHLLRVNPGFSVGQAVTFRLGLPDAAYRDDGQRLAFYDRAHAELAALPGVTGVGAVLLVPPSAPALNLTVAIAGRPPLPPSDQPVLEIRVADPSYFHVMNIPVRKGRLFGPEDRADSTPVLLLTESAVRRHFPNEDPIGKHIDLGWKRGKQRVGGDVIGVVADVRSFGLDREAPPQLYLPLSQVPITSMSFVVRTAVPAEGMFAATRDAIRRVDPNLPLNRLETLEAHVNSSIAERRFYMLLLTLFAAIALALAGVGIFGVLSFLVAQRTREIGIRMALGAQRRSVMRLVLRQAVTLAVAGVTVGSLSSVGLTRVMKTMLFDLSPTDGLTFALVDVGLVLVAVLAAWVPTRRATRVDPTIALRAD